jgi:CRP/FNR family transcriptional regulator, cyclic AMP receptor protein
VLWQPTLRKLSPVLLKTLRGLKRARRFASGETLFLQSSTVRGVYLVESGEVRLLLTTAGCERQLVEVAGPGIILGLSENVGGGESYRVTAEAGDQTTAVFIPRGEFLAFLREHYDFCMQIVRLLAEDLNGLYHKFRSISAHPGRPRQRALNEQLN